MKRVDVYKRQAGGDALALLIRSQKFYLFSAEYRTVLADSLVSHVTVLINVLSLIHIFLCRSGRHNNRLVP